MAVADGEAPEVVAAGVVGVVVKYLLRGKRRVVEIRSETGILRTKANHFTDLATASPLDRQCLGWQGGKRRDKSEAGTHGKPTADEYREQ